MPVHARDVGEILVYAQERTGDGRSFPLRTIGILRHYIDVARVARLVEAGSFFHVTARGNYRQNVFFSDQDRAEYLGLLAHHAAIEGLDILGWCCMTNHIHLLRAATA